ncbi:ZIP family metal transporter [Pseudooctadecabacter sp.]|uniref:ZIP family metal transporter n=1 Tax=Pseudooctadecabacter sp. TaxID=1966338 RepID=UPI0025E6B906|nr:zinc transporter [Pseudooctadecabacter sp.]
MDLLIVIAVVSAALLGGALWGAYGTLPRRLEGFLIAMAGGALIVAVVDELIKPASMHVELHWLVPAVLAGAVTFTTLDKWVDARFGDDNGGGLLLAITLDGIPENLALGVALISASAPEVAALAGSIMLSNLPEAAGGAQAMRKAGLTRWRVVGIWAATALLLAGAAWAGHALLQDTPQEVLSLIRAFAAGAVVASLAVEIFPKAYREDSYQAGIAVTVGLMLAFCLGTLGGA